MSKLEEARKVITEADQQIVAALALRFNAVAEVLGYKIEHDLTAVDPARRQAVIDNAIALAGQVGGNADLTRMVIKAIEDGVGAFADRMPAMLEREPA